MLRIVLVAALLAGACPGRAGDLPDVVFLLLDTTRADRLGALGNPDRPTPALDALAASGALFTRHFANAHATRSSMPQLMTGRYYHQNILGAFRTNAHPREYPFSRPDAQADLLPAALQRRGYQTVGVSAHPWVIADSPFGRGFDTLELIPFPPGAGHGDATQVVHRALDLRRARDRTRPLFLYLHFMDAHVPRRLPAGAPRTPVPGFDWRTRFTPDGEPAFGHDLRRWSRTDARDFTGDDRAHFAAVYDTALAHLDGQIGRLVQALRADDPDLRRTVVVAVADHGEELGEDGRTDHTQSLADGVQHIPWIVAGGGVAPGQRSTRMTENIDVAPTLLAMLGLRIHTDGRPQIGADGRICQACGKAAAYFAWEEYRAIRTRDHLLRLTQAGAPAARCGPATLYRMTFPRRAALPLEAHARRSAALRRRIEARLAAREATFRARRYDRPRDTFLVPTSFWQVDGPGVDCVPIEPTTTRSDLDRGGWLWSGTGLFATQERDRLSPLAVRLDVPPGPYDVEAAVVPIPRRPWLFGFSRWARKTFRREAPTAFVPLGSFDAEDALRVTLPPDAGWQRHVVGLRLSPPGATREAKPVDPEQERRLKALGYVQ